MGMHRWAGIAAMALLLGTGGLARAQEPAQGGGGGGGMRIVGQARLDALNIAGFGDFFVAGGDVQLFGVVPIVTGGVRLARLYFGVGLGLYSFNSEDCTDDTCDMGESTTSSGWAITPMVNFDLVADESGALYLAGWLNLGSINSVTQEDLSTGDE